MRKLSTNSADGCLTFLAASGLMFQAYGSDSQHPAVEWRLDRMNISRPCRPHTHTYPANVGKAASPPSERQDAVPEENATLDEMRQPAEDLRARLNSALANWP